MTRLQTTIAFAAFSVISGVLITLSALGSPGMWTQTAAGGHTVDSLGSWWFQWWVDSSLAQGVSLKSTDLLFYPWGKDIFRHTGGNLVDALATVPVRRLFGPVAAWNTLYVGIIAMNAMTVALWARARGATINVSLAAAAITALHPYALFELAQGRPTQAILFPMIAALALADAAFHSSDARRGRLLALSSGAALALAGWTYWFAAGFAVIGVVVLGLGRPLLPRLGRLALVGAVSLLLTSPAVLPLTSDLITHRIPGILPADDWLSGSFTLITTTEDPVVMATLGHHWMAGYLHDGRWLPVAPAMGIVAMLALLPTLLQSWRWMLIAAITLILAVGPLPAGYENPVYLGLMAVVLPMRRLYWPIRALALLVPIGALGVMVIGHRLPRRARFLVWLVPVGLIVEGAARGQLPMQSWVPEAPAAYACLAGHDGALIEIPYGQDHEQLLHQTVHGLPMMGGMNERSHSLVPAEQQRLRHDNTWLRAVLAAGIDPRQAHTWTEQDKQAIHDLGYRWISLRLAPITRGRHRGDAWQRLRGARMRLHELAGDPVFRDEDTIVYAPWGDPLSCIQVEDDAPVAVPQAADPG